MDQSNGPSSEMGGQTSLILGKWGRGFEGGLPGLYPRCTVEGVTNAISHTARTLPCLSRKFRVFWIKLNRLNLYFRTTSKKRGGNPGHKYQFSCETDHDANRSSRYRNRKYKPQRTNCGKILFIVAPRPFFIVCKADNRRTPPSSCKE